jgi:ribosomal protein S1
MFPSLVKGEILVTGQESAVERRTKAVWQELLQRLKDGKPVKGRLLNSLAGGYSVGVAGIVCFLPNRNASKVTASRIGELSDYRVIQMNASRSNVVLSDCRLKRGERDGSGKGRGRGRRGGELLRY